MYKGSDKKTVKLGKYMNKKVTIDPVNTDMSVMANAVRLKNEFIRLGFETSSAFVSIVRHYKPGYTGDTKKLEHWWLLRLKDDDVNTDVEFVLGMLKNE